MFSSLKKKAWGWFEHKESNEVHEHEEDEMKKSEEVIADKSSNDNTKPVDANQPDKKVGVADPLKSEASPFEKMQTFAQTVHILKD